MNDRLNEVMSEGASMATSVKVYAGQGAHGNLTGLHQELGRTQVPGWTITRAEGGYRQGGFYAMEPAVVVEFVNDTPDATLTDDFIGAVARWAKEQHQETLLVTLDDGVRGLWTNTVNISDLLEALRS